VKAAVLYGKEDLRIEETGLPPLGSGEVRIRIEAALTCGTDLKVFKRGYHAKMIVPPAAFGHELAGVITEVAKESRELGTSGSHPGDHQGWRVGDRVVVANSAPCGRCIYCSHGQENLCDDLLFLNGAYAEMAGIPARIVKKNMLRLRPHTSFADAALVEPLACVVQGLADTRLHAGQRVLVIGSGPIGLMFVALARHSGCTVTAAGRGARRLEAALRLGAKQVIDVSGKEDMGAVLPRPAEFDAVIEAVGKPQTWEAALRAVRKGGTINFFGGCPAGTTVPLDTGLMHYSSLKLTASFHHSPHTIRRALELIEEGIIRAEDFVDGECPLDDLPALFQRMAAGNHAVKTLVRVHQANA
jgi:L-iditol 2-dehydrogenase